MRSISSNPIVRDRMNAHYGRQAAIARNAPGWAAARKQWAVEAEQAERRKRFETAVRAAASGEPLTDEQRTHLSEFLEKE
jgi:hypothetical protein